MAGKLTDSEYREARQYLEGLPESERRNAIPRVMNAVVARRISRLPKAVVMEVEGRPERYQNIFDQFKRQYEFQDALKPLATFFPMHAPTIASPARRQHEALAQLMQPAHKPYGPPDLFFNTRRTSIYKTPEWAKPNSVLFPAWQAYTNFGNMINDREFRRAFWLSLVENNPFSVTFQAPFNLAGKDYPAWYKNIMEDVMEKAEDASNMLYGEQQPADFTEPHARYAGYGKEAGEFAGILPIYTGPASAAIKYAPKLAKSLQNIKWMQKFLAGADPKKLEIASRTGLLTSSFVLSGIAQRGGQGEDWQEVQREMLPDALMALGFEFGALKIASNRAILKEVGAIQKEARTLLGERYFKTPEYKEKINQVVGKALVPRIAVEWDKFWGNAVDMYEGFLLNKEDATGFAMNEVSKIFADLDVKSRIQVSQFNNLLKPFLRFVKNPEQQKGIQGALRRYFTTADYPASAFREELFGIVGETGTTYEVAGQKYRLHEFLSNQAVKAKLRYTTEGVLASRQKIADDMNLLDDRSLEEFFNRHMSRFFNRKVKSNEIRRWLASKGADTDFMGRKLKGSWDEMQLSDRHTVVFKDPNNLDGAPKVVRYDNDALGEIEAKEFQAQLDGTSPDIQDTWGWNVLEPEIRQTRYDPGTKQAYTLTFDPAGQWADDASAYILNPESRKIPVPPLPDWNPVADDVVAELKQVAAAKHVNKETAGRTYRRLGQDWEIVESTSVPSISEVAPNVEWETKNRRIVLEAGKQRIEVIGNEAYYYNNYYRRGTAEKLDPDMVAAFVRQKRQTESLGVRRGKLAAGEERTSQRRHTGMVEIEMNRPKVAKGPDGKRQLDFSTRVVRRFSSARQAEAALRRRIQALSKNMFGSRYIAPLTEEELLARGFNPDPIYSMRRGFSTAVTDRMNAAAFETIATDRATFPQVFDEFPVFDDLAERGLINAAENQAFSPFNRDYAKRFGVEALNKVYRGDIKKGGLLDFGFKQVPDDVRKYGKLAGKWLPENLFRQIEDVSGLEMENIIPILRTVRRLTGMFKGNAVPRSMAAHVNQFIGNTVKYSMLGGHTVLNPRNWGRYGRSYGEVYNRGAKYQEWKAENVFDTFLGSTEVLYKPGGLKEALSDLTTPVESGRKHWAALLKGKLPVKDDNPIVVMADALETMWRNTQDFDAVASASYMMVDEVFKMANILKLEEEGWTKDAIRTHILKWYPHYGRFKPGGVVDLYRKYPLGSPFISFRAEDIRINLWAMKEKPWLLAILGAFPLAMKVLGGWSAGLSLHEQFEVNRNAPPYKPDTFATIPLYDRDKRNGWWTATTINWFPGGDDLASLSNWDARRSDIENIFRNPTLSALTPLGHPFVSRAVSILMNKDPYSGLPVVDVNQPTGAQVLEGIGKTVGGFMPPMLGGKRLWDTVEGFQGDVIAEPTYSYRGKKRTWKVRRNGWAELARGLFGLRLEYVVPAQDAIAKLDAHNRLASQISAEMERLKRQGKEKSWEYRGKEGRLLDVMRAKAETEDWLREMLGNHFVMPKITSSRKPVGLTPKEKAERQVRQEELD